MSLLNSSAKATVARYSEGKSVEGDTQTSEGLYLPRLQSLSECHCQSVRARMSLPRLWLVDTVHGMVILGIGCTEKANADTYL